MNRKARRVLEKKLGSDFPIDKFLALAGYYNHNLDLDINDFMIFLLKKYIPILYDEVSSFGGFDNVKEFE